MLIMIVSAGAGPYSLDAVILGPDRHARRVSPCPLTAPGMYDAACVRRIGEG